MSEKKLEETGEIASYQVLDCTYHRGFVDVTILLFERWYMEDLELDRWSWARTEWHARDFGHPEHCQRRAGLDFER